MRAFTRATFTAIFVVLCLSFPASAHEPPEQLTNPGFRPESALSTTFIRQLPDASFAVFPTIVRTSKEVSHSTAAQPWVVEFLEQNGLGTGLVIDGRFEMRRAKRASQWDMFQSSMATIGRQVDERKISEDYVLVVEIIIPPISRGAKEMQVFGVHCFVLEPDGNNAFSFLLNSHHKAFNDERLRTSDLTATGRERLASKSTKLALRALQAQILQDPAYSAGLERPAETDPAARLIDDFDSGLPSGTDETGIPIGFDTFTDATSTANISVTTAHPARDGEADGNQVLQLDMDLTGWAGLIHRFGNEAAEEWVSRDWSGFLGVQFWIFGNDSGTSLFFDVLDNRKRYSTTDDAERYTYRFKDDVAGWRRVTVPFAKMVRKEIHNAAPTDGLNLSAVHGWALGNASSVGRITYYIDDVELYDASALAAEGEPLPPASDSRWMPVPAREEGRFQIAANARMDPPTGATGPDYPKLAVFTWRYRARMNGMPKDKAELERILEWARNLDDLLVAERVGFQFGTRGGAETLRSYFYVADAEKMKALSVRAGEQYIGTAVTLNVSDDPTWAEWRTLTRPTAAELKSAETNLAQIVIPAVAMDAEMRFEGFSVQRPDDYRWRLIRNFRTPYIAKFSFAPLSATHSFNAGFLLRGLPSDFSTPQEFKAFVDAKKQSETESRLELLSFASSTTELHGQWAVRYEALWLDTAPVNSRTPLQLSFKGVAFLHPSLDRTAVDAYYSERGTARELDGSLDAIGEDLIGGVMPE